MIQRDRIRPLNNKAIKNRRYVVYWMQASQRAEYNHALEFSILRANKLSRPIIVYFGIAGDYPEASERHYYFMLEGLRETQSSLEENGIRMIIWDKSPERGIAELSKDACLVVVDGGYLGLQKKWRSYAAKNMDCSILQVESDAIVPVETASPKEEYSAATFRPKIKKKLDHYLVPMKRNHPRFDSLRFELPTLELKDLKKVISSLNIDPAVKRTTYFRGGTQQAKKHLEDFLKNRLNQYQEFRNNPERDHLSNMSPYLHFGQISPLYIALKTMETGSPGKDAYLEELIVRRELSINYVFYNLKYDSFDGIPEWAKKTLKQHEKDQREYIYTLKDLENARTHDPYWNAAQKEMVSKGKMHGYMRMYWGKKIIEWSRTPEKAFEVAIYLNNKYELDGRDPNGFTGIAWCFGKHDRPWKERKIFGKIRYMSAEGLKRKSDMDAYIRKIESSSLT
ncbi:MAG: deoxyribodipyrimidine photo-lyase [Candidatus Hodarchaeota archaeon]